MRLFLGIEIPLKTKHLIETQIDELKKKYPQFNWVPMEYFHIPLLFIGDSYDTDEINKRVEGLLFDKDKFRLFSQSLDLLIGKKIIPYLSFQRERPLSELVDDLYSTFNMEFEGKYIPQLSLARYKIPSKQQYFVIKKALKNTDIQIEFDVLGVTLFESLTDEGKLNYKKKKLYRFGQ